MKKDVILFVCIFTVLCLIAGGTYAYWTWISDTDKSVVFTTAGIDEYIIYDEGDSHFVGNFQPSAGYCSGASNTISFNKTSEVASQTLTATINMTVNYTINSSAVKWALTVGDGSSCGDYIAKASGTFNGISSGQTIELLSDIEITEETSTYTIWVWVDSNDSNASSLSGQTIDVNIWSQIDMLPSDDCIIHYIGYDDYRWIQKITEGQSFTVPDVIYSTWYIEADDCFSRGDTISAECGSRINASNSTCKG